MKAQSLDEALKTVSFSYFTREFCLLLLSYNTKKVYLRTVAIHVAELR